MNTDGQRKIQQLAAIRLASRTLHETLKTSWSCLDTTHLQHWVKICVDANTETATNTVTLDVALSREVTQQQQYVSNDCKRKRANKTAWKHQ
jgi:hypothetical protein